MIIRMRQLAAGPGGIRKPGQVVDVPDDEALGLIRAGAARAEGNHEQPEAAIIEPEENALGRGDRRRKSR
jgi:hypothetical protein